MTAVAILNLQFAWPSDSRALERHNGAPMILKIANFTLAKGEKLFLKGASGSGKSTLLQILGSLDKPDSGNVLIDNEDITKLSEKNLANFRNKKIGFIFQFHNLLGEFTALENVCMPAFIAGKDEKEAKQKAMELLEMLGLGDKCNNLPSQLSGGEQQRTAVARALVNEPAIIFADEPSGNLDSKNAQELHQLFFTLREKLNQTFVIVTHNEELANMADYKLVMQDGMLIK